MPLEYDWYARLTSVKNVREKVVGKGRVIGSPSQGFLNTRLVPALLAPSLDPFGASPLRSVQNPPDFHLVSAPELAYGPPARLTAPFGARW